LESGIAEHNEFPVPEQAIPMQKEEVEEQKVIPVPTLYVRNLNDKTKPDGKDFRASNLF
jgi:hypothetical protein